jgi:3-oxoacyl-ACP reductase-like protein
VQTTTPPPQTTEPKTPPPTPAPAQAKPEPAAAAEPPPAQPPARPAAAAPPPSQPTIPPTSPVESDDTLVRGALRTYERAIETRNVDLFRSVWPSLSAVEEATLRDSFRQVDSQQVDIIVESLRIEKGTATVLVSRRDTIVNGGRRQTAMTRQTIRLDKVATGWVITAITRR